MLENDYENENDRLEEANFAHVVAGASATTDSPVADEKIPLMAAKNLQDLPQISPPVCAPTLISPLRAKLRRMFFFGSVLLVNLLAVLWMADLFNRQGFHKSHILLLGIFALLNSLLVLGSFHALAGVWDWLFSWRSVRCSPMKASWKPKRSARMTASRSSRRVSAHSRPSGWSGIEK